MCDKCENKEYRVHMKYQIETDELGKFLGDKVVTRESHCMACGREFKDLYSLRHIATKVKNDGKFEDVLI